MSFDEQPDGDIHGECAAEIHRLELALLGKDNTVKSISGRLRAAEEILGRPARQTDRITLDQWKTAAQNFEYGWMACSDFANRRIGDLKSQLDACRQYLKEGENPAECLARNRADIVRLMGKWGAEKMRSAKLREDLDKIAQTTGSDDPCRPFLKEGETAADALIRIQKEVTALRNVAMQQWADRSVCDKEDAARYRLLRRGQHWSVIDGIGDTLRGDVLDAAIDKALAAQEVAG